MFKLENKSGSLWKIESKTVSRGKYTSYPHYYFLMLEPNININVRIEENNTGKINDLLTFNNIKELEDLLFNYQIIQKQNHV